MRRNLVRCEMNGHLEVAIALVVGGSGHNIRVRNRVGLAAVNGKQVLRHGDRRVGRLDDQRGAHLVERDVRVERRLIVLDQE